MPGRSLDYGRHSPVEVIDVESVLIRSRAEWGELDRNQGAAAEGDGRELEHQPGRQDRSGGRKDTRSSLRRRAVLAGLAGVGLVGAPLLAAKRLLGNSDVRPRESGDRPAAGDGFATRDQSYASTGEAPVSQAPAMVFDSASEAAEATDASVATVLATDDPVIHLLRRVTFGPSAALADEVRAQGIDAWLATQLDPSSIPDETADQAWGLYPMASMQPAEIRAAIPRFHWDAMFDYGRATLGRQIWSRRQLHEVMVDFWANHLNLPMPSAAGWDLGPSYHTDVIRAHALGSFTDMLLAAMQHPAMLRYLSNAESKKDAVNENLGRELLELHTVGIASGYTEDDVRNSAYILTGRTAHQEREAPDEATFFYDPDLHWTGAVQVLDFRHPNGSAQGGMEVGDAYLRYLASHPATAHNLAYKLAVRFVADNPPAALVDRLAQTYLRSGTGIVPMLDILFRSGEFWAAVGQKSRRPLENLVATARVLDVRPGDDTAGALGGLYGRLNNMGHRPLAWPAPNGYPDVQGAWRSASGVLHTWNAHRALVQRAHGGLTYVLPEDIAAGRPQATVGEYVDSLCEQLCFQTFQPEQRDALLSFVGADPATPAGQTSMLDQIEYFIPLILDSVYFALR